jgi:hypothetical protein
VLSMLLLLLQIEMACGYLGVDELDSELRKLISSTCSGNPFFVREMCSSLAASGALQTTRTSSGKERAIIRKASKVCVAVYQLLLPLLLALVLALVLTVRLCDRSYCMLVVCVMTVSCSSSATAAVATMMQWHSNTCGDCAHINCVIA